MPSRFDNLPRTLEQTETDPRFELAPPDLRKEFPLIRHDPSFPTENLPVPQHARELAGAGFQELGENHNAVEVALRLILHFGMHDPNDRRDLDRLLQVDFPHQGSYWNLLKRFQPLAWIKLIDYGAATGGFVRLLRALGAQAYGIDLNDEYSTLKDRDAQQPYDLVDPVKGPLIVMGKDRFNLPETQKFLSNTDMVVSNRLLQVVNRTPDHRAFMDAVTDRVLKPGGLVMTVPAFYDERLDDAEHYGDRYHQFDYRGNDEGWDYSIARKLK